MSNNLEHSTYLGKPSPHAANQERKPASQPARQTPRGPNIQPGPKGRQAGAREEEDHHQGGREREREKKKEG